MSNYSRKNRPANPWTPAKKKRTWKRKALILLGLLAIGILALPTILSYTPVLDNVLANVISEEQGSISVGGKSLGWFSSPTLNDIEIRSPDGELLLTIDSVVLDKSLVALSTNQTDLGKIHIKNPTAYVITREGGSNIEDFLAPWMVGESSGQLITVSVEVADGTVNVKDAKNTRTWQMQELQTTCNLGNTPDGLPSFDIELNAKIKGNPSTSSTPSGNLHVQVQPTEENAQKIVLQTKGVTLEPLNTILQRFGVEHTHADGLVTIDTTTIVQPTSENKPSPVVTSTGSITISQLQANSDLLAGEPLRLTRVHLPWDVNFDGNVVQIQKADIQSDVANVTLQGQVNIAELASGVNDSTGLAGVLSRMRQPFIVQGSVNLAQLTALLPGTFKVRQGTRITSGEVRFALQSMAAAKVHRWSGNLNTSDLVATNGTKTWEWKDPVQLVFSLTDANGWNLEALRCDSDFLNIRGSGTATQLSSNATYDLDRLAARLGQFVDLSEWQLKGNGELGVALKSNGPTYTLTARGDIKQLQIAHAGQTLANEPNLVLTANVSGNTVNQVPSTLKSATASITASKDQLKLTVSESQLAADQASTVYPIQIDANGKLANMIIRLRPWIGLQNWRIDGNGTLVASGRIVQPTNVVSLPSIELTTAKVNLTNFKAINSEWRITDPNIVLNLNDVSADLESGQFRLAVATLSTSVLAARARNIFSGVNENGSSKISGELAYQTFLDRIDAFRVPQVGPPKPWRISGELNGLITVKTENKITTAELINTNIKQFKLIEFVPADGVKPAGYRSAWEENQPMTLAAKITHDSGNDRLVVETMNIQSERLVGKIHGNISKLSAEQILDLRGSVDYDLVTWSPIIASYTDDGVKMTGRDQATFQLAGSLGSVPGSPVKHWSQSLVGSFSAGWEGIDLFGLPVSKGRITAEIGQGKFNIKPFSVAVGQGKINGIAQVHLAPEPQVLFIPQGQVLTNIQITPKISNQLILKYILPVLENPTESEGMFSLSLAGGQIPLANMNAANFSGQITVHNVRVAPNQNQGMIVAIQELLRLSGAKVDLQSEKAKLSLSNQVIKFKVQNGRVYHEGLEFKIDKVAVRSSGSVGMDDSLDLMLEIPVTAELATVGPILNGMRGQSIRVRVGGTTSSWKVDWEKVLQNNVQQAAQGFLEGQLNNALEGFLKPRK